MGVLHKLQLTRRTSQVLTKCYRQVIVRYKRTTQIHSFLKTGIIQGGDGRTTAPALEAAGRDTAPQCPDKPPLPPAVCASPAADPEAGAGVRHTPSCAQLCEEPPGPHWSFQPASCSQSQASPGLQEPQGLTLPFKGVSLGAGCGAMRKSPGQAWKDWIRGARVIPGTGSWSRWCSLLQADSAAALDFS